MILNIVDRRKHGYHWINAIVGDGTGVWALPKQSSPVH
jgi:hypothetical protein